MLFKVRYSVRLRRKPSFYKETYCIVFAEDAGEAREKARKDLLKAYPERLGWSICIINVFEW